jgi:hypothetical protein
VRDVRVQKCLLQTLIKINMKQSIKTGLAVSVLALAVMTAAVPTTPVYAQSNNSLQAQITALLAQIQTLQSQVATESSLSNYTFPRPLKVGDVGEDVKKLQQFLNGYSDTQVASVGLGSKGSETNYYGPATAAAVSKFQLKYRSEILTPAGLLNPTGYFGPSTIHQVSRLLAGVVPVLPVVKPVTTNNQKPTTPLKEVTGSILQGSGDLDTFVIKGARSSTINEAAADAPIAELELEARNGDLQLSRLDLALVADGLNQKKNPWDVFESISLWVDGEKIAEQTIDNKTKYLDRNAGTIRFADLKHILKEGKTLDVTVAINVKSSVRGAGSQASWNVSVNRLRYFDADNVAADDSTTGDLRQIETFDIDERGAGEELKFSLGTNNPIERTIVVDDKKKTTNITLLEYTVEALDNDIELDRMYVNIQTGSAAFSDVIADVNLKIGSKVFRKKEVITSGSYSTTSALVMFEINNKVRVKKNDKADVTVLVDLKSKTAYSNGESVSAQVTSAERDITVAQGTDDLKQFSGSVIGKQQILISEGVFSPMSGVRFSTATQGSNSTIGIFTAEFQVTAVEGDFYIADSASTSANGTTGGLQFTVSSTIGTTSQISASISATADEDTSGVFTIREGETETFTLTVVVDPNASGNFRLAVDTIYFSSNGDGVTGSVAYQLKPVSKFRSLNQFINN